LQVSYHSIVFDRFVWHDEKSAGLERIQTIFRMIMGGELFERALAGCSRVSVRRQL
jgi:hypothetical protein